MVMDRQEVSARNAKCLVAAGALQGTRTGWHARRLPDLKACPSAVGLEQMSGSPSLALSAVCVSLDLMDVARSDGATGMPRLARRVLIGPVGKLRLRVPRPVWFLFFFLFWCLRGMEWP